MLFQDFALWASSTMLGAAAYLAVFTTTEGQSSMIIAFGPGALVFIGVALFGFFLKELFESLQPQERK